ncbi:hypothetical protein VTJ49DRAFT_631 [Mycothermus thermophilus]|uniref:tRNA-splicing endonuclease subunit Sen54 N-terminal domain-containing protein n=1 Tax=Humicola insolens TaxID=85995 RepID=A0ABR3VQ15_HUMIN
MALDDDDNPSLTPSETTMTTPTPSNGGPAAAADEQMTAEELLEDEGGSAAQDFRAFATALQHQKNQFRKEPGVSAQTIRRGEKDFESHGTRAQADALEQSRAAMRDVLSYVRVHPVPSGAGASRGKVGSNPVRGWYFPGWWEGFEEVEEEEVVVKGEDGERKEKKPYGWIRERVVVLEGSSTASQALGRAVTGQAKDRPARGKDWLLPEEALYLVERGSLDLWWPFKSLEELFPSEVAAKEAQETGEDEEKEVDEYDLGIPLSLQAAYALLIGDDGERGKISLQKFQVYSNLKRCGYNVLRAPPLPKQSTQSPSSPAPRQTLWQWLTSRLTSPSQPPPYGPLVRPGLYRSYVPVYRQMALIPRHSPSSSTSTPSFQIHYHVWKSAQKWTKLRHPPPDFRLAVLDAQQTFVPSLREIGSLLDSSPADRGNPQWAGHPGRITAPVLLRSHAVSLRLGIAVQR